MFSFILFIIALLAGALSFLEKRKSNKVNATNNNFNLFAFIFLIISAGVSYWSGLAADKKNGESIQLTQTYERRSDSMHLLIDSINRVNLSKSDTINKLLSAELDTSKSILSYSQQLNKAQNNFLKLQSEQTKNLVGDGSMPQLIASLTNNNTIQYFLVNNSNYPIQDIEIGVSPPSNYSIADINKISKPYNDQDVNKIKSLSVGTLHAHAGYMFTSPVELKNDSDKLYLVCGVTWRYGNYAAENTITSKNHSVRLEPSKYYYNNGKEFRFSNPFLKKEPKHLRTLSK